MEKVTMTKAKGEDGEGIKTAFTKPNGFLLLGF